MWQAAARRGAQQLLPPVCTGLLSELAALHGRAAAAPLQQHQPVRFAAASAAASCSTSEAPPRQQQRARLWADGTVGCASNTTTTSSSSRDTHDGASGATSDAGSNGEQPQQPQQQLQRGRRARQQRPAASRAPPDLTDPPSWYPLARAQRRSIIAHVGPTNSGKTHAALAALAAAGSGIYCGPLRLLAAEVAERLNAAGTPCNLVTGQEQVMVPGARHTACTVEMAELERQVEVAVVDEVQLLGDPGRGGAWTRALLGLPAAQLHVCGATEASSLLAQLAQQCGDALDVRSYRRLAPLVVEPRALRGLADVAAGDCMVAFGRKALHQLRRSILARPGQPLGVGMVYGALPPEARASQAALFNAPPGIAPRVDVLVASDAVGLGLNLAIRRVVFTTLSKFDGEAKRPLTPSEVKQIAGRAGRYGSGHDAGHVAVLHDEDLPALREALATPTPPVERACVLPSYEQLEQFALSSSSRRGRPQPLHILLGQFAESAVLDEQLYVLAKATLSNMQRLAKALAHVEPLLDLCCLHTLITSPASADDPAVLQALLVIALQYARERHVTPDCILGGGAAISVPPAGPAELTAAEQQFRVCELWLWLAGRLGGAFRGRRAVRQQRARLAGMIHDALVRMGGVEGEDTGGGSSSSSSDEEEVAAGSIVA